MNLIGQRIYYDKVTGEVIVNLGEMEGAEERSPVEHDIAMFKALYERNRSMFDYVDLDYGYRAQDFASCKSYKVDVLTKDIIFTYPSEGEEIAPPPSTKPLSVELAETKAKLKATEDRLNSTEDAVLMLMSLLMPGI